MSAAQCPPRARGGEGWRLGGRLTRLVRPPRDPRQWLLRVALLAVLYFMSGWAGLQLAQPPGYATPIWPPSGIMLAMLLLWGRRVWPGIWLGSFAVNLWVGWTQAALSTPGFFLIAAVIACGSTAEGLFGAWAVRRHVAAPKTLDNGADVWRFFALAGLAASAIAASVGTLTLAFGRGLPLTDLPFTWLTWWVGDCMGVFLVAPLLLVAASEQSGAVRGRLRPVAISVLISLAVGALVVHQTNNAESRRIGAEFERTALALDRHLQVSIDEAAGAVRTVADYFAASSFVEPEQFDRFCAGVLRRAPGLDRLAWAPRVEAGSGLYGIDGDGRRRAVDDTAPHFAIEYVHPHADGIDVRGFDLASEPVRAATLAAAQASGDLRVTPRVELVASQGPGVLLVMPVQAEQGYGFVVGAVTLRALMRHLLSGFPLERLAVALVDVTAAEAPQTLLRPVQLAKPALHWAAEHDIGGRRWRLEVEAGEAYLLAHRSLQAWLTQVGVLLFSAMLGGFLMVLTGKSSRVERLVQQRTAELADKNRALLREIGERERSESRLRLSAEVFEHLGEAIMITDAENRIISVNRAFTEITGYGEDEVRGRTPRLLASGRYNRAFYEDLWQKLKEAGSWRGELWDQRKSGEIYPAWLNISLVRDAIGRTTHHVAVFSDISERKAAEERILYLAQVDAVTNLPNRYLLGDRLRQTMEAARRDGLRFAVLFIDIDRFKNINDSLGHSIGDALLREMAERLRVSVRASDTVARHGGDEFVIVMPGIADAEQVAHVAGKILAAVGRPFSAEQHLLTTTASIGIAMYPMDGEDTESLMKHADAAMYAAKSAGRNAFRFFTRDMNARVQQFLKIENELRRALDAGELRVYYQPQFDVRSGEVVAAEALVRWQHPERGLILPAEFMHVAEESGLVETIDDWVLREACRQNHSWQQQGLRRVPVSVNLSAIALHRDDTVERVRQALRASGLDASWLELEVTESMLMRDVERVQHLLLELRAMGVLIALDDFGTGYSSLAHLRSFPLSALKVDRSFVDDLQTDGNDAAICRAVIALGRTLGLRVIAEGVENTQQLAFLRKNRCDSVQGALFSWAVPAAEMAAFLTPTYVCAAALDEESIL
ncbi:EAL domain-containing protein [Fontimonas sp. SYSU GA230001]|uniref:EAL domain-containing protein n=1 Tax=Fontimonas sp. SYSU GA230001 TaxID=3142450 RepID=UPI0032B50907